MQAFTDRFANAFKQLLPSPFTIAVLLSIITYLIALAFTLPENGSVITYSLTIMQHWETGIWNSGLMVFAVQMMLMLVLGHALALTKQASWIIEKATRYCTTTANAAAIVGALTIVVAFFNWGLGLIFGAILARKVGEHAKEKNLEINYPLVGAAGYVGLMVWHGGLSGSALSKVAEEGHLKSLVPENSSLATVIPDSITYADTVFSTMNIFSFLLCLVIIPTLLWFLGKNTKSEYFLLKDSNLGISETVTKIVGAEKLDYSPSLSKYFGLVILGATFIKAFWLNDKGLLAFFTPNNINFFLLGAAILLHANFNSFLKAIDQAISGVSGILIQFPLYFGIMGIMSGTGLVEDLSNFFVSISNEFTYPIFTYISAGIVNIFVPSGGGQWAVQGPIIVQAATELGVSLPKTILAMAYGDQLTNMLQPFWALPLLGITGLRAKEILPYCLILFLAGGMIFLLALLLY